MKVAVVILNWNGRALMEKFLPSVVKYTNKDIAEVIVADNDSSDDSIEFLEKNYPDIRIVRLDKNYGFAGGYNMALKQIDAEYFVLLNSDVEVAERWVEPVIEVMDNDKSIAAAQPKIKAYHNKESFEYAGAAGGFIDYLGYPFCRGRMLADIEKDNGQYDSVIDVFWCTGTALFIRSEVFLNSGGLDEHFFAHMEEIDLCWRLHSKGHRLVCVPQSVVYHVGGGTLPNNSSHKLYLNFRNSLLMLYKNLPAKVMRSILFKRKLLDGVAAVQFLLKFELKNCAAVWKAHRDYYSMVKTYRAKREQVQRETVKKKHATILGRSMIFLYFLKRKRLFSEIEQYFDTLD
jgi:GT2 family glycosyltransferase